LAGFVDPKNTCNPQLVRACDPEGKTKYPELISEQDEAAYLNCIFTGKGLPASLQGEALISKYQLKNPEQAARNFWALIHDPCSGLSDALYRRWSEEAGSAVLAPSTSAGRGAKRFLEKIFTRFYHLDLEDIFTSFTEQALAINVTIYDDGKEELKGLVDNIGYDVKGLFQFYEDKDLKKYGVFLDFARLSPERKKDFSQVISKTVGELHAYIQEGGKIWFLLSPNGENSDVLLPNIGRVDYPDGDVLFGVSEESKIRVTKDKRYPIAVSNKESDALVATIKKTLLSCGPHPCEIILTDVPEDWNMFPVIQTEIQDILEARKKNQPEASKTVFLTLKSTNGEIITRKISAFDYFDFSPVISGVDRNYPKFFTKALSGQVPFTFFAQKAGALSCVTGENLLHCAQNFMLNATAGNFSEMFPRGANMSRHRVPLTNTALEKLFSYSLRTLLPNPESSAAWDVERDGAVITITSSGVENLENLKSFYDKKENESSAKVIPVIVKDRLTKMDFEKGLETLAAAIRDLPVGPFAPKGRRELLIEIRREK